MGSRNAQAAESSGRRRPWLKALAFVAVLAAAAAGYLQFGSALTLESLAEQESQLRQLQQERPVVVYVAAFAIYVAITGLSLPGAAALTLIFGWYFGLVRGAILVSFASTSGATVAFLLSRYLLRQPVQRRLGERLARLNRALERDGPFYLFTLRLIPVVPFFVINLGMGLTPLRTITFWWVSQLGMLPGTVVYVYAGSTVPSLRILADEGVKAVFSPGQLTQVVIAFSLIGVFSLLVRLLMSKWGPRPANGPAAEEKA